MRTLGSLDFIGVELFVPTILNYHSRTEISSILYSMGSLISCREGVRARCML